MLLFLNCFPVTPCSSNPCVNSGSCMNVNGSYGCVCSLGYSGKICEGRNNSSLLSLFVQK